MRKLLLLPLRLAVGWGLSPRLLSVLAAVMLVLLRLSIGWHFYAEGIEKVQQGDWSAAPFFVVAKGPLAEQFRGMVWDHEGAIRLDRDRMMLIWANDRDRVAQHYGFDKKQVSQAQKNYTNAVKQYDWIIAENADDLEEYRFGKERIAELNRDPVRSEVRSLRGQREAIRKEWTGKGAAALNQVIQVWVNYIENQNDIATAEQQQVRSPYQLSRPRDVLMDTSLIDSILPYFDVVVGLLLLFGLFTPVAALAAAGFLCSVVLSQYPPVVGLNSSIYQLIEAMGCFVIAATGAGRFAGLDFFLHLIVRKVYGVSGEASD